MQGIDHDTSVVPRGCYRLQDNHKVEPAFGFQGLSYEKATDISSWVHFRQPENLGRLRGLTRDDTQFHTDFLDGLDEDLPCGCWTIRYDVFTNTVALRSLLWPGYSSYHVLGSQVFGGVYIGNGDKVPLLPFLLP